MQLDWTTFFLEILNFLILVWLLSRFFYRPVMNIIARRRKEIKQHMDEALQARTEAETLKQKYETRVLEWEKEKSVARAELHEAIAKERGQLMQQLHEELNDKRHKEDVVNQRMRETERQKIERLALEQGASFSARLLTRLASHELESAIADLFMEDLTVLPPEQQQILKSSHSGSKAAINIYSAYPLTESCRARVEKSLSRLLGEVAQFQYRQDPCVIAGLRVVIGSRVLQATIQDELKYFIEGDHAGK